MLGDFVERHWDLTLYNTILAGTSQKSVHFRGKITKRHTETNTPSHNNPKAVTCWEKERVH